MLNEFDREKSDRKFLQGRVYENIERRTKPKLGELSGFLLVLWEDMSQDIFLCLDKCSRKEQAKDRTVKN